MPLSEQGRNKLLAQQTAQNRQALAKTLLVSRQKVEASIVSAARDKRFGVSKKVRDKAFAGIGQQYLQLQGSLDTWTKQSILDTSKVYHNLGKVDLKELDGYTSTSSFVQFSKKHTADYFDAIHPFNADKLAAVNVNLNPQLVRMADTDVRALRSAVVDVFREAELGGLTGAQRGRLLQQRVMDYADDPASWKFIDKAGKTWRKGNYFDMLNRTVTAQTARHSYNDTLSDEGRDLVEIIGGLSENSNEACEKWVGHIVSLSGTTDGYPSIGEYESDGGFHPNCVHTTAYMSTEFPPTAKKLEEQKGNPAPKMDKKGKAPTASIKTVNPKPTVRKSNKPSTAQLQAKLDATRGRNKELQKEINKRKKDVASLKAKEKEVRTLKEKIAKAEANTKRIDKKLAAEDRRRDRTI